MDRLTKKQRSDLMRRIKSPSALEIGAKGHAERVAGCRLRHWRGGLKMPLLGSPDWFNKARRTVVFVHGCFWHGCPAHFRAPKTNSGFWAGKIAANRRRDGRVLGFYRRIGWRAFVVWEHDLKKGLKRTKMGRFAGKENI